MRQVNQAASSSHAGSQSVDRQSTIRFHSNILVGNLGESLIIGDKDNGDYDNETSRGDDHEQNMDDARAARMDIAGPSDFISAYATGSSNSADEGVEVGLFQQQRHDGL